MIESNTVTISKDEYEELLDCKKALIDLTTIKNKNSKAYKEYIQLLNFNQFCKEHHTLIYRDMKRLYEQALEGSKVK